MPYPTRSRDVIDFYTPINCYIQWEYPNDMVSDDVDIGFKVKFYDFKVCTKKSDSVLCMGKISHYYDVVLISGVECIDKQCNDNYIMKFLINLFGKDDNDAKRFKELTTIVPHDWNSNLFALYLYEEVMKIGNALFVHINPETDDSVEDIPEINLLYK